MNKPGLALSFVAGMVGCDGCPPTKMATNDSLQNITPTCNTRTFHDIANHAQDAIDLVLRNGHYRWEDTGCEACNCERAHALIDSARICMEGSDPPQVGILDTIAGNMARRLRDLEVQVAGACDSHGSLEDTGPVRAVCNEARQTLAMSKIGISHGIDFWEKTPTKEDIEALNCP